MVVPARSPAVAEGAEPGGGFVVDLGGSNMWSCLLLTDAGVEPVVFSGVTVVPAGDPIALVDAVGRAAAGHVLVVAPRSHAAGLHLAVTVVAGHRPDLSVAWLVSDHAPLAMLSALALARAATVEPAIGVELAGRLLAGSWSGAWTGSVARLSRPNPRLGQHLRSLLPGSGFLLRQSPSPAVLAGPRTDDVPPAGMDRVLLVQDGAVPAPVAQRLAGADRVTAVRQVALPGAWSSVYGTHRTGQLALMPAEPQALLGPVTHRCPSCGLDQLSPTCPFCRTVNAGTAAAVQQARPAQPVRATQPAHLAPLVHPAQPAQAAQPGHAAQPAHAGGRA